MTKQEFRTSAEYAKLMERIQKYRPGFEFTVNYELIRSVSIAKLNGMRILLEDAIAKGYLESIALGYSMNGLLEGFVTEEKFRRTSKDYLYLGELP